MLTQFCSNKLRTESFLFVSPKHKLSVPKVTFCIFPFDVNSCFKLRFDHGIDLHHTGFLTVLLLVGVVDVVAAVSGQWGESLLVGESA